LLVRTLLSTRRRHQPRSVSQRTHWRILASFEFDIPPLDHQLRIEKILWAVDEAQSANEAPRNATTEAMDTTAKDPVFPFG
jgi:hypothetical protein